MATALFPNRVEPNAAAFNLQQIQALAELADVRVVAPIPWFPFARLLAKHSRAVTLAAVPGQEVWAGLRIAHPRRPYIPKLASVANGPLATLAYAQILLRLRPWADVVLATWAYPDAWAVTALCRLYGLPVVVKVHGSDLNVVARSLGPRALLRTMLPRAGAVVAVSSSLRAAAIALGVARDRAHVVRNGVDRLRFRVRDRGAARVRLGLPADARVILFVGHLQESKGLGELLASFERLARDPRTHLLLVGDGPMRPACEQSARKFPGRVLLSGECAHHEVPEFLAAADVLTLPSHSEGLPNVILEAIACGRRVVATDVGGVAEVVTARTGTLIERNNVSALTAGLAAELSKPYDQLEVARESAADWTTSSKQLLQVLESVVAADRPQVGPMERLGC